MKKKSLFRIVTASESFSLLNGQLAFLNEHYKVIGVAGDKMKLGEISIKEGVGVIFLEMKREIVLWQDLLSLYRFIRLFKREQPFIVHANTPKASLLAMAAAWLIRVPHRIYTVTGLRFETTTGAFRLLLITMERLTCFFATKVIPEGEGVKATLRRERITRKPLEKILNGNINGVDLEHFDRTSELLTQSRVIREQLGIPATAFVFGFIGRLVKDKGINELVQAFIRLQNSGMDAHLLLVGSFERELDPLLPETEELIATCSAIHAVGYQQDVRPYFLTFDALAFPSYREGFPNVVLQAGAMGIPAIVTDINGCNEIIEEGVNGTIIPPRYAEALYQKMREWILEKDGKVAGMAGRARQVIADRYEQKAVWQATLEMYQGLGK